jgi:diphthine synthase
MKLVTFIGLGLNDEMGITLEGLEEAKKADSVFAEFYTNLMPALSLRHLEQLIGKNIQVLDRRQLEDERGRAVATAAQDGNVAFLVPGDPMIATTHVSLRLAFANDGIKTRIIHGPSIVSAVCGATGLQSYKFGKTTTIPFIPPLPASVLETIRENQSRGLHTLLLLDVREGEKDQLTISGALARVISADPELGSRLAVGVARLGAPDEKVKSSSILRLIREDFGPPPQSIVLPGKLHFMEVEALRTLAGATSSDLEVAH